MDTVLTSKTLAGQLRNARVYLNLLLQKFDDLDAEATGLRLDRLFAGLTSASPVPGATPFENLKAAVRMRLLSRDDVRATMNGLVEIRSWARRLQEIASVGISDMQSVLVEMDGGSAEDREAVEADINAIAARAKQRLVGILRKATIPEDDLIAKGHGGPVVGAAFAPS